MPKTTDPLRNTATGDRLTQHTQMVDRIASIAPPPPRWRALRARADSIIEDTDSLQTKFIDAVVSGDPDADLPALKAGALALAAGPNQSARLVRELRIAVDDELETIYAGVAVDSYSRVAAQFDAAADKFTACARKCDVDADSDTAIESTEPARKAWLESLVHARAMDKAAKAVVIAAELCAVYIDTDELLLALLCDPGAAHRRRTWEAWRNVDARCGRWGPLAKLGVTIRAWPADQLDHLEEYRAPKQLVRRYFPGTDGSGFQQAVVVDPEDAPDLPIEDAVAQKRAALTR